MTSKGYALARAALVRALTAYTGITTADGAFDGTATLVDSNLKGRNDFITGKTILIMSGDAWDEDKGAASFVSGTGTITLQGTGFSAQIKQGTIFRVLNISSVEIDVANIASKLDRKYSFMDFWSAPEEEVQLTGTAGDKALPDITVADLPSGATVVRAIVMLKFRMVENTHATIANKLDGATVASTSQVIQIRDDTPGTYYDCINFVDDQFGLAAATREGGDVIIGNIDVAGSGKVDANGTYNLRWLQALADEDNLQFNDVQVGVRVFFE